MAAKYCIRPYMEASRSPLELTISVWKALFLREAVQRLFGARAAWLWLFLEPMAHIAFLLFLFTAVRMRVVGGIDTPLWLMTGLLAFFTFKRCATQAMNAVEANRALFAYRQVKPVDTVLSRAALEGFLMLLISLAFFSAAALWGHDVIPAEPLSVLEAFGVMWLLGLGLGLMSSVAKELVPELGRVIGLLMTPLYFASAVMFPLNLVPSPYIDWLLYNPLIHAIESARLGFAPHYLAVEGTELGYAYAVALVMIFLGLALQLRHGERLASQ